MHPVLKPAPATTADKTGHADIQCFYFAHYPLASKRMPTCLLRRKAEQGHLCPARALLPCMPLRFSVSAAKVKVLKSLEESVPAAFVRFYSSTLFDRLLHGLVLYFCSLFQQELLSRTAGKLKARQLGALQLLAMHHFKQQQQQHDLQLVPGLRSQLNNQADGPMCFG